MAASDSRRSGTAKSQKVQAVILAGGMGTRLRPYTFMVPKPMLPVGPKPILEHILVWLKENGITDVVISTGYLGKVIQEYFGAGKEWGVKIEYAKSARPLGTAGQLKAAESKIRGRFVCVYGDAILEMDLRKVIEFHAKHKALATMALMKYSTGLKYGFMETDEDGRLTEWREKPTITGYINVGCFVMEKAFLRFIPAAEMYGMDKTFQAAMGKGAKVYGVRVEGQFTDIGDRKSYVEANDAFVKKMGKLL
ncbi:MAG TPA: nucleotidyltransferase family protein [Nitrososphaerales archaeon]|nr:nucleotidyltransferase family protein [Nitrososphaerales archaeon]